MGGGHWSKFIVGLTALLWVGGGWRSIWDVGRSALPFLFFFFFSRSCTEVLSFTGFGFLWFLTNVDMSLDGRLGLESGRFLVAYSEMAYFVLMHMLLLGC